MIRNVGYNNIGPTRDGELFDNIPGPAEDFLCQWYDLVASGYPEEVRNDSFETHGLLNVGVVSQARNIASRREIDSP